MPLRSRRTPKPRSFGPRLATVLTLVSAAILPCVASAQPTGDDDRDLIYEFPDDQLLGDTLDDNTAVLVVRPGPVRTLLLRPRTHFIREMQKSIEQL